MRSPPLTWAEPPIRGTMAMGRLFVGIDVAAAKPMDIAVVDADLNVITLYPTPAANAKP